MCVCVCVCVCVSTLPHSLNNFVILHVILLSKSDCLAIKPYLSPALDGDMEDYGLPAYTLRFKFMLF